MDQTHKIPRKSNPKREAPARTPSPATIPPISCKRRRQQTLQAEVEDMLKRRQQTLRAEVEDMLKRTHGVSFGALAASSPRGPFHQETSSSEECGRPRRGKTPKPTRGRALRERSLHTKPLAGPVPKEYQGSHKRDMAAYHAPWKGNQWSDSPNLS